MRNLITISARDLSVGYNHNTLIPDITFDVHAGEIMVLIGPNGAGKSTILKTLTARLQAIDGIVCVENENLSAIDLRNLAKKQSVLMTDRPEVDLLSVEEMVAMGRYPYTGFLGTLKEEDHSLVCKAMELVGITEIKDCDFNRISDGQKQLTLLAKAICQQPRILIMDEPASFLDISHKLQFISIIRRLAREEGITVIMSLHELDLASRVADSVLCIGDGMIDRYGAADDIFAENGYIEQLYKLKGSFIASFGCIEPERNEGKPDLFVIGGGKSAISVYRSLHRKGQAFYAGILSESDIAYPVSMALAAEIVSIGPYKQITQDSILRAQELIDRVTNVILVPDCVGDANSELHVLIDYAHASGKLEVV